MKTQMEKEVDLPEFSKLLMRCRQAISFDIDDLSRESNVGTQVLREWEKGRALSLSLDSVRSLIRALKLKASEVETFLSTAKSDGFISETYFNTLGCEISESSVSSKKDDGAEAEPKTSASISRDERRSKRAEAQKPGDLLKVTEEDEAAAEVALADIVAEVTGEAETETPVTTSEAGEAEEVEKPEKPKDNVSSADGLREVISPILDGNVPNLPVSDLFPDPDQPRQTFYEEDLKNLGGSILTHGQMLPTIVLIENGCKVILDGERRWRACKKMGIRNIYAIVVKSLKIDKFLLSAICNFGREDHTPLDKARAVSKAIGIIEGMAKKSGEKLKRETIIKKVADGFCKSTVWVYQYLSISRLDQKVQELVGKGELSVLVAFDLAQVKSREAQIGLAKKITGSGMSAKAARQLVRQKIEEEGGRTRKEKRNPKDDYRILRTFVYNVLDHLNIILNWGSLKIIGLFYNREGKDRKMILEYLDKIIPRLQKLRKIIHNQGSIGNEVLVEDDEEEK